jgi:Family of unknown function (DUF6525)
VSRRMRMPQYGRPRPDLSKKLQEYKVQATEEMQAYDQLPLELQVHVRSSRVGWRSATIMEYWQRLGRDTDVTLNMLRDVEEQCYHNNQVPTEAKIQLRRS